VCFGANTNKEHADAPILYYAPLATANSKRIATAPALQAESLSLPLPAPLRADFIDQLPPSPVAQTGADCIRRHVAESSLLSASVIGPMPLPPQDRASYVARAGCLPSTGPAATACLTVLAIISASGFQLDALKVLKASMPTMRSAATMAIPAPAIFDNTYGKAKFNAHVAACALAGANATYVPAPISQCSPPIASLASTSPSNKRGLEATSPADKVMDSNFDWRKFQKLHFPNKNHVAYGDAF
jgi:hypothetical protein